MTQINAKNNAYFDCYLAFLDILGFGKAISEQSCHDSYMTVSRLLHVSNITRGFGGDPFEPSVVQHGMTHSLISSLFLSDSLLLYTHDSSAKSLNALLHCTRNLVGHLLMSCLPLRGAISFGSFYCDVPSLVFFGPVLVEAVRWERAQQWAGVILTPSCAAKIESSKSFSRLTNETLQCDQEDGGEKIPTERFILRAPLLVKYDVPLHANHREFWCINWCFPHSVLDRAFVIERAFTWHTANIGAKERLKMENTLRFFDYCSSLQKSSPNEDNRNANQAEQQNRGDRE